MQYQFKEVDFNKYCKTCVYSDTKESEDPCDECLANPMNEDSHKPVMYKEKENKNEKHES